MTTGTVHDAWIDVGAADDLAARPLQQVLLGRKKIALACKDGEFSAISGICNHAGGPLGEGKLDGDYVVCPWHYWKFHCRTGEGEPGYEDDRVPAHDVRVENGRVLVNPAIFDLRGERLGLVGGDPFEHADTVFEALDRGIAGRHGRWRC